VAEKQIKIPGPDHPITIDANPSRVVVTVGGKVIADTRDALTLREASYPAVQYPRKDVDIALLERTDHATYCPYKGDCAYFSIPLGVGASDPFTQNGWVPNSPQSNCTVQNSEPLSTGEIALAFEGDVYRGRQHSQGSAAPRNRAQRR
jgi:uncharacterized protein (DUF427 family)